MENFEDLFARIIFDYDCKGGHYVGLNYSSPHELVCADTASRSGHSVEAIRTAITLERVCRATSCKFPAESKKIYNDWISAYTTYLLETGFIDAPFGLYGIDKIFHNTKFLNEYCKNRFKDLGSYEIDIRNNHEILSFNVYIRSNPEISLAIRFEIVKKYGGTMRATVIFRRHVAGLEEIMSAKALDIDANMMGKLIFSDLGISAPPDKFELIAEHRGTEVPNVDKVLSIIERTALYCLESK